MNADSAPRFVPLTAELLDWALAEQPAASEAVRIMGVDGGTLRSALHWPHRAEAMLGRGRVLAVAGVIQHWPGRGEAWMLASPAATRADLVRACRRMRAVLDEMQDDPVWRRIEMHVLAEAPWRLGFAAALGFTAEATLRAWDPAGRDFVMYARV